MPRTLDITRLAYVEAVSAGVGTASSVSLFVPGDTVEGDYLLAYITHNGAATVTPPPGWTLLASGSSGVNTRASWFYRWAEYDELATQHTFTLSASLDMGGFITGFANIDPTNPVAILSAASPDGTTHTTPAVAVPQGGWLLSTVSAAFPTGTPAAWSTSGSLDLEVTDQATTGGGTEHTRAVWDSDGGLAAATTSRTLTANQAVQQVLVWSLALRPASVTYPEAPLGKRLRMAFGADPNADPGDWDALWVDVSDALYVDEDIAIKWGRGEGAAQAEASEMSLTIKNTDGRFTSYDPRSVHWPYVVKGVPIWYEINAGNGWRTRYAGFVNKWPLTWPGRSAHMALAKIVCGGTLRRLNQGDPPVRSAKRRFFEGMVRDPSTRALSYHPCEEEPDSSFAANMVSNGPPMYPGGIVEFGAIDPSVADDLGDSLSRGSLAQPQLNKGGSLTVDDLPQGTSSPVEWTVVVHMKGEASTANIDLVLAEWDTPGGTFVKWQIVQAGLGRSDEEIWAFRADGTKTVLYTETGQTTSFTSYVVAARQAGANIEYSYTNSPGFGITPAVSTVAGTLTRPRRLVMNPARRVMSQHLIGGHAVLLDAFLFDAPNGVGDAGFSGEWADDRLRRLCTEDGVRIAIEPIPDYPGTELVAGQGYRSVMAKQPPAQSLPLYRQVEGVDRGLLAELGFGLLYVPRGALYRRPTTITLDVAARELSEPFDPVDDDARQRNSWTVSRIDGTSATYTNEDHASRHGRVPDSLSLPLWSGSERLLPRYAQWMAALGSVEEHRYPAIGLNLGRSPQRIGDWLRVRSGARVRVENLLPQHPPFGVDQLVVGGTEKFRGAREWSGTMVGVPASPYDVWTWEGPGNTGRIDTDGSTLAQAADDADTVLYVQTTGSNRHALWDENPAHVPFMAQADGEPVEVVTVGPAVDDHFSRFDSAGGWAQASTTGQLWVPNGGHPTDDYYTDGTAGVLFLPAVSSSRNMLVDGVTVADFDITARVQAAQVSTGAAVWAGIVARWVSPTEFYRFSILFQTGGTVGYNLTRRTGAGFATLASGTATGVTYAAYNDVWVRARGVDSKLYIYVWRATSNVRGPLAKVTDTAIGSGQVGVRAERDAGNTNSSAEILIEDFTVTHPQRFEVVRGGQGWTKQQTAGRPVRLYRPSGVAL